MRSIFDRRHSTGVSPCVLLTNFTSRRTLQQVRMTIRIPCKVSEHMAPRPSFEKRRRTTIVVSQVADRFEQRLVRCRTTFDVLVQETGVDVHTLSTVVSLSCARPDSE
jgi:hypothetical protein